MRFTAMNRGQRGKLAMATAAVAIGLLSVTGCGYINAQQTTEQYSASDGTREDLGPLQIRNFMIVSTGEDKPGRVIGAIYNSSSSDVKLTINGAERLADAGVREAEFLHPAQRVHGSGDPEQHGRQSRAPCPRSASPKTAPTRPPRSRCPSWTPRCLNTRSTCRKAASPPSRRRPRRRRRHEQRKPLAGTSTA